MVSITGAMPFATDAGNVSMPSVEIIVWDSLRFGQNVMSEERLT